jgi:hypothetical protein
MEIGEATDPFDHADEFIEGFLYAHGTFRLGAGSQAAWRQAVLSSIGRDRMLPSLQHRNAVVIAEEFIDSRPAGNAHFVLIAVLTAFSSGRRQ